MGLGLEFCLIGSWMFQEVWDADFAYDVAKSPMWSGFFGRFEDSRSARKSRGVGMSQVILV